MGQHVFVLSAELLMGDSVRSLVGNKPPEEDISAITADQQGEYITMERKYRGLFRINMITGICNNGKFTIVFFCVNFADL